MSKLNKLNRKPAPCPRCGSDYFRVYGTKISTLGRRTRRWTCHDCGFRKSTVEVDMADYKRLVSAERFMTSVSRILGKADHSPQVAGSSCRRDCLHFEDGRCGFGFPEALEDDAEDCATFTRRPTPLLP